MHKCTDNRQRLPHAGLGRSSRPTGRPVPIQSASDPGLHARRDSHVKGEIAMLYTIAVILLIAWLLGIVGTYTIGAFVHLLLVVAIVLFLVGLVSGRRTLA